LGKSILNATPDNHLIDLGPEGGKRGGQILVEGTPKEVAKSGKGFTGEFLGREMGEN
jgi:excinuclease ABC subunit A